MGSMQLQPRPLYGIGTVARLTGVKPDTLRIWENRRLGAAWCTSCSRAAECCASCSERRCAQHVR